VSASRFIWVAAFALLAACSACAAPKKTASGPVRKATVAPTAATAQSAHRKSPYVGAVSADAQTGKILFADNAEAEAYPASVTKLMTLLLVLEDVKNGKYALDDKVVATADVNKCEASWIGIKPGESMSVRDLCYSLMVVSANDAAIVLGVHSAGSLAGFVARMNARAAELGMTKTQYFNPNGLPAPRYAKSFNRTTAADQLKLAIALLKLPEVLGFTSVKTCDLIQTAGGYRTETTRRVGVPDRTSKIAEGEKIVKQLRNHNNIMVKDKQKIFNPDGSEAVDGLKTGYIDAGGSSIVITAKRNNKRVVAVVLGSASAKERDAAATRILTDALGAVAW